MSKGCYLSTTELHRLDLACAPLHRLARNSPDGDDDPMVLCGVYLVGSATERPDYRDVDVRMILDDATFDRLFADRELWALFCYNTARTLAADTGLPIDFQVQRMTEANDRHTGPRNPVGHWGSHLPSWAGRDFAGLGDATPYLTPTPVSGGNT